MQLQVGVNVGRILKQQRLQTNISRLLREYHETGTIYELALLARQGHNCMYTKTHVHTTHYHKYMVNQLLNLIFGRKMQLIVFNCMS